MTLGATSAGGTLWRLANGTVEGLDPVEGHLIVEASVKEPVAVAGSQDMLAVLTRGGDLLEIDPATGGTEARTEVGPDCHLIGGQDAIWLHQPANGVARRIDQNSNLQQGVLVNSATHLAISGDDLWWVTERDTVRASNGRSVHLDEPLQRSGAAACAGSLWLGATGHLIHVSLRTAKQGPSLRTDTDTPTVLACSAGRLFGADSTTAIVMDPAADANVVRVGPHLSGPPVAAVGFRDTGWILSEMDALLIHF
jgi:hypothetical protein